MNSSTVAVGLPQPDLAAAIPRLRRYARVLTRNPAHADDLVQDTLLRAWDKRTLWQVGTDLRAWLFTIMHNVHQNQRALARREAETISLDAEGEHGTAQQVSQHGNQLERVELRELLGLIGRLPAEQREALLLAAVEELSYAEISIVLAIPIGTVMSRISRAREKLRHMTGSALTGINAVRANNSRMGHGAHASCAIGAEQRHASESEAPSPVSRYDPAVAHPHEAEARRHPRRRNG